jgi:serine protease inhibitor
MIRTGRALFWSGVTIAWLAVAPGCSSGAPQPMVCSAPTAGGASSRALASANTAFAAAFFSPAVAAAGTRHNLIFSPYSVSTTLTMVDAGAAGDTAGQIQRVLHLPGTATSIAPAYAALACDNETDGTSSGNQLAVANSVWAQQGMGFEHAFVSLLANGYAAPLQQVDFASSPEAATLAIDRWVSSETSGKFPSLLSPEDVDVETRLVLVNAVYFAGTWESGFDPRRTSRRPFTLSDGSSVEVPMMSGSVTAGGATEQMTAGGPWVTTIELPYQGGALALDVIMPGGSLSDFEASLTADALTQAIDSAAHAPRKTQVALPKFTFTTKVALAPVLATMGITDVFDPRTADLSGMDGRRDLFVSRVVQQAFVQVDEQGTVAAAATASTVETGAIAVDDTTTINQPFMFVVRDRNSGSILFLGHVEDPRQSS